jgi:CxxC motif-containing protein
MTTKDDLIHIIKNWISNDNEIKTLQEQLRNKKKNNKILTDQLVDLMKNNEISVVDIKNGKLVHKVSKTKKPINKQSLINILNNYYKDETKATELSSFIFENREVTIKDYIHRKINN